MTGRVIEVLVSDGDTVGIGDLLVVVESMKMENEIMSEHEGRVASVHVKELEAISEGDAMLEIETA
jgi:biotin carboxyl carrier protein